MEMTQFAMVEELASLIKDNLFSKHLILSTEEALVNFLEDDASPEGVLELKPMSPYHRLLLHRLADIYGFAHESVGEGEERHLVLERCPESAIPSILISDILWQYDDYQSPVAEQYVLRRSESPAMKATKALSSSAPIEEREASYLAARDRIFALNEKETVAPRSRNVSAAARRMIAHALGQKLSSEASNQSLASANDGKKDDHLSSTLEKSYKKTMDHSMMRSRSHDRKACNGVGGKSSTSPSNSKLTVDGSSTSLVGNGSLEREQRGAAKRIFAHALGLPSKGNHRFNTKPNGGNKPCDLRLISDDR